MEVFFVRLGLFWRVIFFVFLVAFGVLMIVPTLAPLVKKITGIGSVVLENTRYKESPSALYYLGGDIK